MKVTSCFPTMSLSGSVEVIRMCSKIEATELSVALIHGRSVIRIVHVHPVDPYCTLQVLSMHCHAEAQ